MVTNIATQVVLVISEAIDISYFAKVHSLCQFINIAGL